MRDRTGADLFARIVEAPDDDAPRLVYADWLMERGNPRGKFIRMSCEFPVRAAHRLRSLVKTHAREWLGPVRQVTARKSWVFERGFLASCNLHGHGDADQFRAAAGHDELRLVRAIRVAGTGRDVVSAWCGEAHLELLRHPAMRLRSLTNVPEASAALLLDGAPASLDTLKELEIRGEYRRWPLETSVGQRLTKLTMDRPDPWLETRWLADLNDLSPRLALEELSLRSTSWCDVRLVFTRDESGRFSSLRVRGLPGTGTLIGDYPVYAQPRRIAAACTTSIASFLGSLPVDAIVRLFVEWNRPPTSEEAGRLLDAVRRQARLRPADVEAVARTSVVASTSNSERT